MIKSYLTQTTELSLALTALVLFTFLFGVIVYRTCRKSSRQHYEHMARMAIAEEDSLGRR